MKWWKKDIFGMPSKKKSIWRDIVQTRGGGQGVNKTLTCPYLKYLFDRDFFHGGEGQFIISFHKLYFDQVITFWIKYNEVPAKLYLLQNIMMRSKNNNSMYPVSFILNTTSVRDASKKKIAQK